MGSVQRLFIFASVAGLVCLTASGSKLTRLPDQEFGALRQIASKLKKEWDFSVDPCSGNAGWVDPTSDPYIVNNLTCVCNRNTCHVTIIQLKGQNLTGVLPEEFANLTSLAILDLSLNYLNGSIPVAWASLLLIHLSLVGNRISGSIPSELGSIFTLQNLTLEDNQLQGLITKSIGNLINLNRFMVSANNLSGELPETFGKLKNMTFFRIDGNPISGRIPSFIGNWTKLQRLDMQGTSLQGPFPPIFATLKNITQLRVSDLKGGDGKFPPLQNMMKMKYLVLTNLQVADIWRTP